PRRGLARAMLVILVGAAGCPTHSPPPRPQGAPQAPAATPPPAGSKLAGVREGMTPEQVQKIAGAPASIKPYVTGKAFIPWYFGPDRSRTAYYYKGQGRVIFSGEAGLGTDSHVVRVEYDPSDPGAPR